MITDQEQEKQETAATPDAETVRSALAEGIEEKKDEQEVETEEEHSPRPTEAPEQEQEQEQEQKAQPTQEPSQDPKPTEQPADDDLPSIKSEEGKEAEKPTGLGTQKVWDRIKNDVEQQFGEGTFTMPEGITQENEYETLIEFLSKSLKPNFEGYPDMVQEIVSLHDEGKFDPQSYISERAQRLDVAKLPDQEMLFHYYKSRDGKSEKNPDGVTDEDITEFLEKKSKIELRDMAQSVRQKIGVNRESIAKENQAKQQQAYKARIDETNAKIQSEAQKAVNQNKGKTKIMGIEFSEQEKKELDKKFVDMLLIDSKTQTNKLTAIFADYNKLYELVALMTKGDLSSYITEVKETTKEKITNTLNRTLDPEKGSTKTAKLVDRSKLV